MHLLHCLINIVSFSMRPLVQAFLSFLSHIIPSIIKHIKDLKGKMFRGVVVHLVSLLPPVINTVKAVLVLLWQH